VEEIDLGRADPTLDALEAVAAQLRENMERAQVMLERIEAVRALRQEGSRYRDMGPLRSPAGEGSKGVVELVSQNLFGLVETGARLRRELAAVLHAEGLTTWQIAELFGVSRQRVSALLAESQEVGLRGGASAEPGVSG
jgi:hypothetical protein